MNNFNRCNKVTGVYWLTQGVQNITSIKIHIKPQDGISLPKFEDYSNEADSTVEELENSTEVYEFTWQEKVFSRRELQRYADAHNCVTENELNHHNSIINNDFIPSKIFTYVHEDYYLPLPASLNTPAEASLGLFKFNISEKLRILSLNKTSSSTAHLFRSEENLTNDVEQWIAMHFVFDNSEYNQDSNLLLKQESVLLSIYHNTTNNCVIISPDNNDLELNPYTVVATSGVRWPYKYCVEVKFDDDDDDEERGDGLMMLLRKMSKKWEKSHKPLLSFVLPPIGKKQYDICIEILTADSFDMDNLYIDYTIQIPDQLSSEDQLRGSTHVSKSSSDDDTNIWHFSHLIELHLLSDIGEEPPPITIILEAISTDWWGRHRTEGYTHLSLTLAPGYHKKQLSCSRPEEKDSVEAYSRRFFIGGCHLIQDLDVLTKPQIQDASYKFTKTGNINLRWHTICQSQKSTVRELPEYSSFNTSNALLQGAETALNKYRRAREKLAAATKEYSGRYTDGAGDS